ncbi:aldehyde dehydrogenase [Brucella pseudogrignonensis]|uniref:thiamine pyrophosphate-dependent enzyme n=1 Tax=Brucella pseudogrignonensis TaxID=419475 RepID=UPI0007DA5ADF|nr:thiamine pyrophosphate-dependent enzyme [Brucella pseudogrignonensis]ANG98720.1 aldehyde dehydrogenase [Brucella pseudogrignonensis]
MTNTAKLDRREVVGRLLRDRKGLVAISSLGSATYDLAAAGDHPRNFYLWGAMGGAADVGLGLAIAQPETPVMVLIGDGEALMGMNAFATIAQQKPKNLTVVILDNGLYGETGSQTSHTASGTDLAAVAAGCGIAETPTIEDAAGVEKVAERINSIGEGPAVILIRIDGAEKTRFLPSRDGVMLKTRVRKEFGLESM